MTAFTSGAALQSDVDSPSPLHVVRDGGTVDIDAAARAVTDLLVALGHDPTTEHLADTPQRVARGPRGLAPSPPRCTGCPAMTPAPVRSSSPSPGSAGDTTDQPRPTKRGDVMRKFSVRPTLTMKGRTFKGLRGWSGKPMHPPLTDIPIAAYIVAAAFDVISAAAGDGHSWARELWHAGTYTFIGGAVVSVFAALTG